jgi:hypothetical protein
MSIKYLSCNRNSINLREDKLGNYFLDPRSQGHKIIGKNRSLETNLMSLEMWFVTRYVWWLKVTTKKE